MQSCNPPPKICTFLSTQLDQKHNRIVPTKCCSQPFHMLSWNTNVTKFVRLVSLIGRMNKFVCFTVEVIGLWKFGSISLREKLENEKNPDIGLFAICHHLKVPLHIKYDQNLYRKHTILVMLLEKGYRICTPFHLDVMQIKVINCVYIVSPTEAISL